MPTSAHSVHPLLKQWWAENPADPDRATINSPDVRRLAALIAPGDDLIDLGGTMSLNTHLPRAGLVLRVHRPFVSRQRIRCEQAVRRELASRGALTAVPVAFTGKTVLRCGTRLAEIEPFIPHKTPAHTEDNYRWLFGEMGDLHRHLADIDVPIVSTGAATYAPPGSLARWLSVTVPALSVSEEGREHAERLRRLANGVRRRWVPARQLPNQSVHGDFRLGNVVRDERGKTVVLDFGFMANRPRIHDVAYTLAFMVLALRSGGVSPAFIAELVATYSDAVDTPLSDTEIAALPVYAASVMLHAAAHDGYAADPLAQLDQRRPFLDVAEWFLAQAAPPTSQ